jgi:hypothetical protein
MAEEDRGRDATGVDEDGLLAGLRGRARCLHAYLSSHTDSKLTLSPRMKT